MGFAQSTAWCDPRVGEVVAGQANDLQAYVLAVKELPAGCMAVKPGDLVERLRAKGGALLDEAADMIEAMERRIEADDKAYKELERRYAD